MPVAGRKLHAAAKYGSMFAPKSIARIFPNGNIRADIAKHSV
jgi:hypothetical protein